MSCATTEPALGAYVLGALDPAERAEVEAHLERCPACRDDVAELAGLPGLLARLSPEEATAAPVVAPPALLKRLLAAAARERASRRRRWLAAVAAAVVLMAGGAAAVLVQRHATPRLSTVALSAVDPHTGVSAQVHIRDVAAGSLLTLRLSGVRPEERCRLVVIGKDGSREVAASWVASYVGRAEVSGTAALPRSSVREVLVETFGGQRLVSVPV